LFDPATLRNRYADPRAGVVMVQRPPWRDEDGVAKLAIAELEDAALADECQFAMLPWDTHPSMPISEFFDGVEREAVAAFKRGNVKPLAALLRPDHPMNKYPIKGRTLISTLAPSTWQLISDLLAGRRKGKRGRPRKTEEERRAINPVHDATDAVVVIEQILRKHYPEQDKQQIRDRALQIVEHRSGISQNTLAARLKRSKHDHRLPMNHPKTSKKSDP
jgi:hypothetical protein